MNPGAVELPRVCGTAQTGGAAARVRARDVASIQEVRLRQPPYAGSACCVSRCGAEYRVRRVQEVCCRMFCVRQEVWSCPGCAERARAYQAGDCLGRALGTS